MFSRILLANVGSWETCRRYRRAASADCHWNRAGPANTVPSVGVTSAGGIDCLWNVDGALVPGRADTVPPARVTAGRTAQKYSFVSSGYVRAMSCVRGA